MTDTNANDVTVDAQGNPIPHDDGASAEPVKRIGRYRIEKVLGKGGFGLVYLAHDEQLDRPVAVKIPHADLISKSEDAEAYLAEARMVARLDHPSIVPVHDVGSTADCPCYIVSKYIEGTDLATRIKRQPLNYRESTELVAIIAEALHYAHKKGLVHRDVKPGNILIDNDGKPFLVDFGLALREENIGKGLKYVGTPAYMSPEQARGEGHRVDGRSDIFSLGVVLYYLLAGRKPFRGDTQADLVEQITSQEPKPLLQYDERLPKELQRICFKALSKRASDRYSSGYEMSEDLRQFLAWQTVIHGRSTPGGVKGETQTTAPDSTPVSPVTPISADPSLGSSGNPPIRIIPKGLRSFDAHDADFFLELLPGPRDRNGLPDSLRFWKTRIEETDPDNTFSVGLIYGPSGCGKSSLVKAGLLPRLSEDVITVYIEATQEETETRLLHGLRKRCPALEDNLSLKDTLAALRRGHGIPLGKKVLIVLDQFEQWLHAKKEEQNTDLVQALRQCDGARVQCIVMVRDDFWLAVSRFLRELEVRLVEGENSALADLFDLEHARKVLAAFGRAFGRLPENKTDTTSEQKDFVKQSVADLAEDCKVICVRLALFSEMMKGKNWTPTTLKDVGGTTGVGVTFLEETFSASTAPPEHRYHQQAARAVLRALLPDSGTDIKGEMKSRDELLAASGYASRPKDFDDLIRILDSEIRLITPTHPEGRDEVVRMNDEGRTSPAAIDSSFFPHPSSFRYYQLTHDYLVPSLRDWLTRKQKETRRGRAELKLAERSSLWNARPENRYLPSLTEWLSIRTLTESKDWTAPQRAMMSRAARVHGLRSGLATALLMALILTGLSMNKAVNDRRNQAEATRLVEGLLAANTAQVSTSLASLKDFRTWADPQLQQAFKDSAADSDAKMHAGLALLAEGQTVDPAVLEFLQERLLTVTPGQFDPVRTMLEPHKSDLIPAYWQLVLDAEKPAEQRFHAACALAAFDPNSAHAPTEQQRSPHASREEPSEANIGTGWNDPNFTAFVAEQLVSVPPVFIGQYQELVRPVAAHLVPALSDIFEDPARGELAKNLATSLLADYAAKDPGTLTTLVLAADAVSDKSLFPVLQQHQTAAVTNLEAVLDQRLEPDWKDAPIDPAWTEPTAAIRAQIETAHGLIAERFAFCQDMPLMEFLKVAETLRASGYRPTRVRPWEAHHTKRDGYIGAIWTRDNRKWHIDPALKKSNLPAADANAIKNNLLLADIAAVPVADPSVESDFIALWCEPASTDEQRRVLIEATEAELAAAQSELKKQNFVSQCTVSVRTDASGQRHYTGIWSNQGAPSELRPAYAGFELVEQPQWDVSVAPAAKLADPRFAELLSALELPATYAALWRADIDSESKLLTAVPLATVLDQLKPLLAAGWRPFAIAVNPVPAPPKSEEKVADRPDEGASGAAIPFSPATHLLLHRPIIPDAAKESLALQQAAAATALLRLNAPGKVWPLFQDQPDPRLRSYVQHRLSTYGVHPELLFTQLQQESDVSCQRSLILGIGEFAQEKLLSPEQQTAVIADLAKRYATDPDPGIHGAAEWTLRQLDAEAVIVEVQTAYSTGAAIGDRRWYLTRTGGTAASSSGLPPSVSSLSFAIIDADDEFLMGSPVSAAERFGGPTGENEIRHRRRIGRRFAIGMHEITVAQFQAFRSDHPFDRMKAREDDAPANIITWYDAAAYCNWLSKQEGLPPKEWCYDPDQPFAEGMPLVADYLQRTGYRLPSEAEWEYACRAGTTTARYFGETESLLGEYAWYTKTSDDKWMLPVGTLRPNGVGLFDMQGNVLEWCQDSPMRYDTDLARMGDREQAVKLSNSPRRVLRGGAFYNLAADVRSAYRVDYQPDIRDIVIGFRVARTYP